MASTTLTATYRIVTPMFCSGADQTKAELRLASFKGALRFWWRSLMTGKVGNNVQKLREEEAKLFGSSDQNYGQSKVRMRLVRQDLGKTHSVGKVFNGGHLKGAHYLGYGVMEAFARRKKGTKAGELTRPMIDGGSFTVSLRCHPGVSDSQREQLKAALILLGSCGGLGSKSRKGFGSLTLTSFTHENEPQAVSTDPIARMETVFSILDKLSGSLPSWTAWSQQSRIVSFSDNSSPVQLLNEIGKELVYFRSWGNKGRVLDRDREGNFKQDHDLSKGQSATLDYPARVAFGLPHSYGRRDVSPAHKDRDRRASPLFIHIDQTNENQDATAILTFLPSEFLPDGDRVRAFGRDRDLIAGPSQWFPIHAFLDRLTSDTTPPQSRPGYEHFPDDCQWWETANQNINATEVQLG